MFSQQNNIYVRRLPKSQEPIFWFIFPTDQLLICLHQKQSTYIDLWFNLGVVKKIFSSSLFFHSISNCTRTSLVLAYMWIMTTNLITDIQFWLWTFSHPYCIICCKYFDSTQVWGIVGSSITWTNLNSIEPGWPVHLRTMKVAIFAVIVEKSSFFWE